MKEFWDDGTIKDVPVTQPVMTLEVPRYEYARLVRDAERFQILVKLAKNLDAYDLKKVLDALINQSVMEDE